ncbi:N-acylneuraminate cytidylyltransferase [Planococcus citri]|uniref:N-acylneuraminate cytidylyltransferase n=1 Tax=Planococcus citri TaxID=170843 RepID=UPI0031F83113
MPTKCSTRNVLIIFYFHFLISRVSSTISPSNSTNENYVALILARGGSKSIPHKNLANLENKSLLRRTIEVALHSRVFNSVWVSTDYLSIYQEAKSAGANVFGRSSETASDTSSSLEAVKEFIDFFPNITVLALLQCTSPFQSVFSLRKAYHMMKTSRYDSIFSVTPTYKLRWKRSSTGDNWEAVNFDVRRRPRRQDMQEEFIENGMFYWVRTSLLRVNLIQGGRIGTVIIPAKRSLEIDYPEDLIYGNILAAEILLSIENEKYQCSAEDLNL